MARKKLFAEVNTKKGGGLSDFCRVWISRDLADELQIVAKQDWLYMSKDWMGILSTQALVEGILDAEGYTILASPDRMVDAHFEDGDKPKVWKLTKWE